VVLQGGGGGGGGGGVGCAEGGFASPASVSPARHCPTLTFWRVFPQVGIFVSVVSTKIPFKGTSKEYIGEDVEPIAEAVRKALMQCAVQLKHHIARREAEKDARNRRKNLTKYVPDVSDALFKVLAKVYERDGHAPADMVFTAGGGTGGGAGGGEASPQRKRARPEDGGGADGLGSTWWPAKRSLMASLHAKTLTKQSLANVLVKQAESADAFAVEDSGAAADGGNGGKGSGNGGGEAGGSSGAGGKGRGSKGKGGQAAGLSSAYLVALPMEEDDDGGGGGGGWGRPLAGARSSVLLPELRHPAFSIRLLRACFVNKPG